jgi:hypothetical protein
MAKNVVDAATRRRLAWQGGRGKHQLAIKRALLGYGPVLTTAQLAAHVFPRLQRIEKGSHWYTIARAAERYATRASPRTRPLKWIAKPELLKPDLRDGKKG